MRKFAILIFAVWMIAGAAGVAADDGPQPPAPNLFPPKAGCPPNMLGVWQMIYEGYQDIYGDVTITPDAIEFGKIGRFKLSSAGPLLDGIDWSKEPLALPVRPEDLKPEYSGYLLKFEKELVGLAKTGSAYNFVTITYGAKHNRDVCNMDIILSETKLDMALMLGGQEHFSKYGILIVVPILSSN
ncbi:hypothetical protein L2D14_01400 [Thalassospiraceae bacterium LMO-JJ14]|nr:hypothetical protein L2D14_01400 [Thalassospiraceae bacterium LMO-JJ14]